MEISRALIRSLVRILLFQQDRLSERVAILIFYREKHDDVDDFTGLIKPSNKYVYLFVLWCMVTVATVRANYFYPVF